MKRLLKAFLGWVRMSDTLLLLLCLLASGFGLVLIYSATRSYESARYMTVQIASVVLGLGLFFFLSILDVDILTKHWYVLLAFNVLLLLVLKLWGVEGDTGNRSWLRFLGVGIQPSEVIKVSFVLLLARQLEGLRDSRWGLNGVASVAQLVMHVGLMFGLIVVISADLGSALVFLVIFAAMCFAAGLSLVWFLAAIALCGALTPLLWTNFLSDYQKNRILAPYFPELVDPDGLGVTWQANQSKVALASGGFSGQGYLQGVKSQSELLPFKHTDFIFSVAGEELGLLGCLAIVLLLTVLILRVLYVGLRSGSYMDMLICVGFSAQLTFQAFENIGMCAGLTPVIGITLPFFSYGGSSMITCFAAMGVVSGIRLRSRRSKLSHRLR